MGDFIAILAVIVLVALIYLLSQYLHDHDLDQEHPKIMARARDMINHPSAGFLAMAAIFVLAAINAGGKYPSAVGFWIGIASIFLFFGILRCFNQSLFNIVTFHPWLGILTGLIIAIHIYQIYPAWKEQQDEFIQGFTVPWMFIGIFWFTFALVVLAVRLGAAVYGHFHPEPPRPGPKGLPPEI